VTSGVPLETTAPPKTREWKFWATILWVAASVAAFFIVGVLLVLPLLGMLPSELKSHPLTNAVGWLIPWFGALGVFALAIRLTGMRMRDYLGFVPPRLPDIGIGLAGLVVLFLWQCCCSTPPRTGRRRHCSIRIAGQWLRAHGPNYC